MNQEFAENIKNHIREYLPVDYQDAKITLEKVTKGNDRILTGLIIRKDDETAAPSIYLEHYEEQFGKGRPMDDINGFISYPSQRHCKGGFQDESRVYEP